MNDQKVILITGCSSGFGLLTAARLAARGHFVWATMRDTSKAQGLQEELNRRKAHATIRPLDVTKPDGIKNVVEEIQKEHHTIDVLINNAGYGIGGFFEDLSEEDIRRQMEVNFFGVQNVCRQVIPLMRRCSKGRIINISSISGQTASPCLGAYSASKWALEAFSESLSYEMKLFGIDVVLVEPGSYPTKIFSDNARYAIDFDNPQSPYYSMSQKLKEMSLNHVKGLKRDPEDIARLILYIVETSRPRLRYIPDFSSWLHVFLRKSLPPSVYGYFLRKAIYG